MTFSIAARDARTGALGVATATAGPAVGALVPHGRANAAAVATQAMTNPYIAIDLLANVEQNGAQSALDLALAADPESDRRQVIVVDAEGGTAVWTGGSCQGYAGHRTGKDLAVAGNILAGPSVLDAMLDAASSTQEMPEKLLAALKAGHAAGGDNRGINSAALKVYGSQAYPDVDLRIDWSADPLADLADLMQRTLTGGYAEFFAQVMRRG